MSLRGLFPIGFRVDEAEGFVRDRWSVEQVLEWVPKFERERVVERVVIVVVVGSTRTEARDDHRHCLVVGLEENGFFEE